MAELVLQIEALAKANVSYESQIVDLSKWKTAAEAEAKSATIAWKSTAQGLEKSETLCGRLTNELTQVKAKLSAEVHASASNKLHWANTEAGLSKSLGGLQKERDTQDARLKTTQLALSKTQAELQECRSDLTANRDTLSAPKRPPCTRRSGCSRWRRRPGSLSSCKSACKRSRQRARTTCCKGAYQSILLR